VNRPLHRLIDLLQALMKLERYGNPSELEQHEVLERPAAARSARRRSRAPRRLALALAVFSAVAATAAGVFAYFTATGHGAGSAPAGTASAVTLAPATPTTKLYPAGTADVAVAVTNPNDVSVRLPSLQLDSGGITVDGGHSGCVVSKVHYTTQDNGGQGYDVPSGTSTLHLDGAISMDGDAPSECQGATFTVYLKVGL